MPSLFFCCCIAAGGDGVLAYNCEHYSLPYATQRSCACLLALPFPEAIRNAF